MNLVAADALLKDGSDRASLGVRARAGFVLDCLRGQVTVEVTQVVSQPCTEVVVFVKGCLDSEVGVQHPERGLQLGEVGNQFCRED